MPGKDHGPTIKDDERYESLREEGMSKEGRSDMDARQLIDALRNH